jgi:hypothetical protein
LLEFILTYEFTIVSLPYNRRSSKESNPKMRKI